MTSFLTPTDAQQRTFDVPSVFDSDFELYEDGEDFVLTLEIPGFDPEDIKVAWDAGVLNVGARQTHEGRGGERTYHRRFRFPKEIDEEQAYAEYNNGILEVRLPVIEGALVAGREIPVEG
jgi:HSP20 family protein